MGRTNVLANDSITSLEGISDAELLEHIASVDYYLTLYGCNNMARANCYLEIRLLWKRELDRRERSRRFLSDIFSADL